MSAHVRHNSITMQFHYLRYLCLYNNICDVVHKT